MPGKEKTHTKRIHRRKATALYRKEKGQKNSSDPVHGSNGWQREKLVKRVHLFERNSGAHRGETESLPGKWKRALDGKKEWGAVEKENGSLPYPQKGETCPPSHRIEGPRPSQKKKERFAGKP